MILKVFSNLNDSIIVSWLICGGLYIYVCISRDGEVTILWSVQKMSRHMVCMKRPNHFVIWFKNHDGIWPKVGLMILKIFSNPNEILYGLRHSYDVKSVIGAQVQHVFPGTVLCLTLALCFLGCFLVGIYGILSLQPARGTATGRAAGTLVTVTTELSVTT